MQMIKKSYDYIVVGSGGGSFCAALVMRAAGKSVLVLEKTDLIGGTTAISGGVMWIPNNAVMKREGIEDSAKQAICYLEAIIDDADQVPGANQARREAYVHRSAEMLEFLEAQGLHFRRIPTWPDYYDAPGESQSGRTVVSDLFDLNKLGEWKAKLRPGFLPLAAYLEEAMQFSYLKRSSASKKVFARVIARTLFGRLRGKHFATAGQALQAQMLHAALEAGAEVRVNADVKRLLIEDNKVVGVVCNEDGSQKTLTARTAVLINAGGFAHNQEMLDRYIPGVSHEWSLAAPGDTGDLIREGIRIGAAVAQMDQRVGNPVAFPPDKPIGQPVVVQNDLAKPHSMVVDQQAQRYMREANSYMEIAKDMLAHNKQSAAIPSWLIMDSRYLDNYMLAGTMPGRKKPKSWTEQNFLRTADSIEELATACELDATALRSSVDRFNSMVNTGQDSDFQRGQHVYDRWLGDALAIGSPTLGSIEEAPFFAIPVFPGDVSTFGGLLTDEHARVLREDGSVIDGLYATGTSTASVMGRTAAGAGASIGPALTWAYVAALHASNSS